MAGSAWGKKTDIAIPPLAGGSNTASVSKRAAPPDAGRQAWHTRQQTRPSSPAPSAQTKARTQLSSGTPPQGQGNVPWHQFHGLRLSKSIAVKVDYSTGNLLVAATDFDIAGVAGKLTWTRTYNSLDAPWGAVSNAWWLGYERYLDVDPTSSVDLYDQSGARISFARNTDGSFTTPAGYSLDLKKNSDNTYTLTDRKSGSKDTYDQYGNLTGIEDRNGNHQSVDRDRDADNKVTGLKVTDDASGRSITLERQDAAHWNAHDTIGRTVKYHLDGSGRIDETTDAEGNVTKYNWDSDGRLEKITTSESRAILFGYDDHNRLTSYKQFFEAGGSGGGEPTWTLGYAASTPYEAGTTTVTDPTSKPTTYDHNSDGEVTKVTDPLHHSQSKTYTQHLTQTATDALGTGSTPGNVTTYGWDNRNNPTSAKLPTGALASFTPWLNKAGMDVPDSFTTPDNTKTAYGYDAVGNTTSVAVSGTGGGTTTSTYNPSTPTCGGFVGQRCTSKDARGKTTNFTYDDHGNLTKTAPPTPQGATTATYDVLGRPTTVTDGRGITSAYSYDNLDQVRKVTTSGGLSVTYVYDLDGNLTARTDQTGTVKHAYDGLGRETLRTLQDNSQSLLTYTADGNVDTYQDPAGTTDYTWDDADRLVALKAPDGQTTTYGYDANDHRTSTTYPGNTVQSVTLDPDGKPKTIKATSPQGTLVDLAYTYTYRPAGASADKNGIKIYSRTDTLDATHRKTTYSYNDAGRLNQAQDTNSTGAASGSWLYCYDAAGNLTNTGTGPTCNDGTAYGYNDPGQLTTKAGSTAGWSYDANGNETSAAPAGGTARTDETWNDFGQQTSITTGSTTYPVENADTTNTERIRIGDTWFHHTQTGLAASTTGNQDTGFVREPAGTLNSMTRDGKSYYYLTDATGNILALVDPTGTRTHSYTYTPTGQPRTTTEQTPQPYRYAGAYLDPTGLYKMGARSYDPSLGRFTSTDPSGQDTNPYLYADGDPINRTDPTGLFDFAATLAAAGAATAGAVVGTLLGGPILGGFLGGCLGGAVGERTTGGSLKDAGESCATWGVIGAIGGAATVFLPKA
ncbi:RHS repeat-associated core domain-containing protein [Streptomyces sp. SDr-06]|uniref:RHS repeat-associated core domain-containing protein n=1 Tax=Streptomyces sp. SDr-06 TaxID=2267702 RepID=UPI0021D5205C|nr:RHS repeat-associated core domain-containing protein [Streptomyces sp. SDr-06]